MQGAEPIPPTPQTLEQCRRQWLDVCRARGTPAPEQAGVARFLANLSGPAQAELARAVGLCLKGREKQGELATLSWAAACTRPALLARLQVHGLDCAGHQLFAAGLNLVALGWDMSARLAQLADHPEDIEALRDRLTQQAPSTGAGLSAEALALQAGQLSLGTPALAAAGQTRMQAQAMAAAAAKLVPTPKPEPGPQAEPPHWFESHAPDGPPTAWAPSSMEAAYGLGGWPPEETPCFEPQPQAHDAAGHAPGEPPKRPPQVRLFGKEAAHTLEIGPHRRGGSFMGVQVVTVESARALAGGGYDWGRKLTVQLTPEEMPAAIAVLMKLSSAARFGQHGAARDKFLELRRQEDGLVVVTGQGGSAYAVPVRRAALYYLLALFARAMAQGLPGGSVAEVLALVKASQ